MARARISDDDGIAALANAIAALPHEPAEPDELAAVSATSPADRQTVAAAVRYTLQVLAERAKGNTVEVRVPPFGAVQCILGPGHTRGTPPNVVEMDAPTWLALVTGTLDWTTGVEAGRIHASGQRADLRGFVPLAGLTRRTL